jgi:Putative Ig domain
MKIRFASHLGSTALLALMSVGLVACGGGGSASDTDLPATAAATGSAASTVSLAPTSPGAPVSPAPTSPVAPAANTAPQISGKSVTTINAGAKYQFVPTASDADGSKLTFSVQNKPEWASFETTTGALTGTPVAANVGTYSNIIVSVTDGVLTTSLAAFTVAVNQMSDGTATLDWTPPTENVDGTVLTNLAGYKLYYGTSASSLSESVKISNPGLSSYTVSNLSSGTWYFAITAISASGTESAQSGVVTASM